MKRLILAASFLVGGTALASAQTVNTQMTAPQPGVVGFSSGDFAVRVAFTDITPLVASSHIDGIGGSVGVTSGFMPEVDLSYFITDNISVQAIATSTRHEITADNTILTPKFGSSIDLGSTYVLPPAVVAQYHFTPHDAIDAYVGVGIDLLWPYDTNPNGAKIGGVPLVSKLTVSNTVGPVFNIGWNYNIQGPWFLNVDYKQVFNRMTATVNTALGTVKANLWLDPAVVSVGIVYRF